jgi:hypothetical protein
LFCFLLYSFRFHSCFIRSFMVYTDIDICVHSFRSQLISFFVFAFGCYFFVFSFVFTSFSYHHPFYFSHHLDASFLCSFKVFCYSISLLIALCD